MLTNGKNDSCTLSTYILVAKYGCKLLLGPVVNCPDIVLVNCPRLSNYVQKPKLDSFGKDPNSLFYKAIRGDAAE